MSKFRVQLTATIDTLAHATTIKNNVQTQLAGKDIFELHSLEGFEDKLDNTFKAALDCRFNSEADRDTVKDWIKDQIQNHPQVKNWVSKAKLSWHRCTHSESEVQNCTTTDYFEWSK